MRVLNIAYPFAPVGPDAVGGAEQVLTQLDAALVRAGHESLVLACEGSVTRGRLVATPRAAGVLDDTARKQVLQQHRLLLERILSTERVDVVHFHGIDFHEYLPPAGVAALATLHLPTHWYPARVFQLERPATFLHCVSAAQRRTCPPCERLWPDIENGIAPELFATRHGKRAFALALGRICPEKGFHLALEAARNAEVPLLLAGQVFRYQTHEQYFDREIAPRLGPSRRFIGPVGLKRKRRLLSAAKCLLAPSLVPETSSLVAMEALACGTPVIAFRSGALADLIEDGKTGFLVKSHQEMAEAIRAVGSLDTRRCRQKAERFSLPRMVGQYFAAYEKLAEMTRQAGSTTVAAGVSPAGSTPARSCSVDADGPEYGPFPLTPALSLGERENHPQCCEGANTLEKDGRRAASLPLPEGEGWGEGEGNCRTGQSAHTEEAHTPSRRPAPAGPQAELLTTTVALEALAPEWRALWERCPGATPFQRPEWLLAWWRHLAGAGLHAVALRAEGRLVGLAPWFIYENPQSAERELLLLGTGITDVLDVLLEPGFEQSGAAAFLAVLERTRERWQTCDFQQLRAESALRQMPVPPEWQSESACQEVCPVLKLPRTPEELANSPAAPLLKQARYYRRRLEQLGPVWMEMAREDNFLALFDGLLRLHGARWAATGQPGVLAEDATARFHREAAAGLLARGVLRLYGLYVGERLLGCWYGFAAKGRVYYYLGGFEPEFARFSLGAVLIGHALEEAVNSGATEFDFLRGSEAYKYRWGAQDCPNYRRRLRHGR